MRKVAYLGVMTREVPPELRSQLGLAEGFGLLVDGVMPDSPATAAGIKEHDILVRFEDQQLVNIEQLMRLWNQWVSEGWLDRKTDSGRSMWRPTASLPIVTRRTREERLSWSDYFSSILELPVR